MVGLHVVAHEEAGGLVEALRVFGGEVAASGAAGAEGVHLGVAAEIVLKAAGYVFALGNNGDALGHGLAYLGQEEGEVGAAEYHEVYLRVALEKPANGLADEVVGAGPVVFEVFHQRHPHGAGLAGDGDVGEEFADFEVVGLGGDGTGGGENADVARAGEPAGDLGGGTDDAKHAAAGVETGQVVLLYGAQGLGRGGVAGQDDELAAAAEEGHDALEGVVIDHVKGARAVGGAGVVTEEEVIVFGQQRTYFAEHGEASETRVEHADGPWREGQWPVHSVLAAVGSGPGVVVRLGVAVAAGSGCGLALTGTTRPSRRALTISLRSLPAWV